MSLRTIITKRRIGHVLVVLIAVTCFSLSAWQFSRLSERKELNASIENRSARAISSLMDLVGRDPDDVHVSDVEYRRVRVTGKYQSDGEVLVSGRARDGDPGYNVLTPLYITDTRSVVYVNRGWIPQSMGDALQSEDAHRQAIAPEKGYNTQVTVTASILPNEKKGLLSHNTLVGKNHVAIRIDTALYVNQVSGHDVYPFWLLDRTERSDLYKKSFPSMLAAPALSERNHLSYALQWIAFGVIAIVTWIVICKKSTRAKKKVQQGA